MSLKPCFGAAGFAFATTGAAFGATGAAGAGVSLFRRISLTSAAGTGAGIFPAGATAPGAGVLDAASIPAVRGCWGAAAFEGAFAARMTGDFAFSGAAFTSAGRVFAAETAFAGAAAGLTVFVALAGETLFCVTFFCVTFFCATFLEVFDLAVDLTEAAGFALALFALAVLALAAREAVFDAARADAARLEVFAALPSAVFLALVLAPAFTPVLAEIFDLVFVTALAVFFAVVFVLVFATDFATRRASVLAAVFATLFVLVLPAGGLVRAADVLPRAGFAAWEAPFRPVFARAAFAAAREAAVFTDDAPARAGLAADFLTAPRTRADAVETPALLDLSFFLADGIRRVLLFSPAVETGQFHTPPQF